MSYADHHGWLLARGGDDLRDYHGRATRVVRAVDGDTIDIAVADARRGTDFTRVRLWGIDCPARDGTGGFGRESGSEGKRARTTDRATARAKEPGEPWGEEAARFTQRVVGEQVTLVLEPHRPRDVHGRLLAHVQRETGTTLNEALLSEGLARADERWPHSRLRLYARAERGARARAVGIWSEPGAARSPPREKSRPRPSARGP